MSNRLSFAIAVNLLTENFKKGASQVKNSLKSMQMQVVSFAAALGFGGLGLMGLISRFRDTARETSRVLTALKNVSDGTQGYADNMRFLNDLAKKYGLEINALIGNFAKFTASATQANMPMAQQKKIFESVSRAITAFSLSASESDGVMLALSQMMSKGKISMEELRKQMGEKLPIATQAMAKALGVSIGEMEKLIGSGKVMSADVLPKFADALNDMVKEVDTDSLESSISRLSNAFGDVVDKSGFIDKFKSMIDSLTSLLQLALQNTQKIIVGILAAIAFFITNSSSKVFKSWWYMADGMVSKDKELKATLLKAERASVSAKNALDKARLNHYVATGKKKIALAAEVAKKEILYARAVNAEDKARLAYASTAATRRSSNLIRLLNTVKLAAAKAWVSIKSMFNSFAPAIIVSGVIALGGYITDLYDKTKWLDKATEDYNKDLATEQTNINILFNRLRKATKGTEEYNKIKNEILSKYSPYLKGLSDEIKSLQNIEGAYKAISQAAIQAAKDRAIAKNSEAAHDKYTSSFAENATELQKRLSDKFGKEKGTAIYDEILYSLNEDKDLPNDIQKVVDGFNKIYYGSSATGGGSSSHNPVGQLVNNIRVSKRQLDEELERIQSAFGKTSELATNNPNSVVKIEENYGEQYKKAKEVWEKAKEELSAIVRDKNKFTATQYEEAKANLKKAKEEFDALGGEIGNGSSKDSKPVDAIRKINQLKKELALEAEKGNLEFRQSELDLEADSFSKKIKQLQLNHDKELFEIKKFQQDKAKAQEDAAKQIYESKHGNTDGFYDYYDKLTDKEKDAILPIELRPIDIASEVEKQLNIANAVLEKGNKEIQQEISVMQAEERLRFASNLDKQLSDTRKYYEDRIRYAQGDAEAVAAIEANREKEIQDIILQSINRQLEFELGYNQQLQQLRNDKKFFETDKRKALLEQEFKDQQAIFNNLSKQSLNDPRNEELSRQLKAAYIQLKLINKELERTKLDKLREVASVTAEIFNSIRYTLDDLVVDLGENANKTLDGITKTFDSIASIDMSNPISAINGAIGALGGLGKVFGGIFGGANYKEYDKLKAKYDTLLDIWDQLLEKKKNYLSTSTADEVTRTEKEALQLIDKQADAVRKLGEARLGAGASAGSHSQWYRMWKGSYKFDGKNWQNVAGEISSTLGVQFNGMSDMLYMTSEQLEYIKGNYSGLWSAMDGEFRDYLEKLIQYGDEAIEIAKQAKEALTGISFDNLSDSFLNTLADMDSDAKNFSENFEEYLRKAILKSMMEKTYAKQLESWYDSFADANRDGNIDTSEYANLQNEWNNIVNGALAERDKLKDLFNWNADSDSSSSQNSSKGYSTSMDQDTGGAILGRVTGLHESVLTITSMLGGMSIESSKILTNTTTINDELRKHTAIFYEMQQMQMKSFRQGEKISEDVSSLLDIKNDLAAINKNTKGLAPR